MPKINVLFFNSKIRTLFGFETAKLSNTNLELRVLAFQRAFNQKNLSTIEQITLLLRTRKKFEKIRFSIFLYVLVWVLIFQKHLEF